MAAFFLLDEERGELRLHSESVRVDGTLAYREMGLVRLRGAPQPARLQGALRRLVKRIRT